MSDVQAMPVEFIKVDEYLRTLLRPLSEEEYAELKASIEKEGLLDSLKVWGDILLDGHHRLRACQELGITPTIRKVTTVHDMDGAEIWIRRHQRRRRNHTEGEEAINLARLRELESKQAKKERAKTASDEATKVRTGKRKKGATLTPEVGVKVNTDKHAGETIREVAKEGGVSRRTLEAAVKLLKADPELAKKVEHGEVEFKEALKQIKKPDSNTKPKKERPFDLQAELWKVQTYLDKAFERFPKTAHLELRALIASYVGGETHGTK